MSDALLQHFLQFKSERSVDAKSGLAADICDYFTEGKFNDREKEIVNEILNYLARDIEIAIRKTISEKLKLSRDLPHDVALKLAQDVIEVSTPILEFSSVLTEEDLIDIIKSTEEVSKVAAIARRDDVSSAVSLEIVEKGQDEAIKELVSNDNAVIDDEAMHKIIDNYEDNENVLGTLVARGDLNMAVAERMVSLVSEGLQQQLSQQFQVTPIIAENISRDAREDATITIVSANAKSSDRVHDLVRHLYASGKLTHSIVLRALCKGDLSFFESGLAYLAGIPHANASKLIRDGDRKAFEAVFTAASMPYTVLDATMILLSIIVRLNNNDQANSEGIVSPQLILEEIIAGGYEQKVPNMPYILALLGKSPKIA